MHPLLKVIGFINCLVNTIVCTILIVILLISGQIQGMMHIGPMDTYAWLFEMVPGSRFERLKIDGVTMGNYIIVRTDSVSQARIEKIIKHEEMHVIQQYRLGVLQPVLYYLFYFGVGLFGGKDKHAYYHNPFEVEARHHAGDTKARTPDTWGNPDSRWIWW